MERWRTIGLRSYASTSGPAAKVDAVSATNANVRTPTETMKDLESLSRTGVDGFIDLISHVRSHNGSSLELHGLHRSDSCDAPFAPNFYHIHFEFLRID